MIPFGVALKFMSGRTQSQEIGRNSVVEGGIVYMSSHSYQSLCDALSTPEGDEHPISTSVRELQKLGVTDPELRRCADRGFHIIVDYDIVDYLA